MQPPIEIARPARWSRRSLAAAAAAYFGSVTVADSTFSIGVPSRSTSVTTMSAESVYQPSAIWPGSLPVGRGTVMKNHCGFSSRSENFSFECCMPCFVISSSQSTANRQSTSPRQSGPPWRSPQPHQSATRERLAALGPAALSPSALKPVATSCDPSKFQLVLDVGHTAESARSAPQHCRVRRLQSSPCAADRGEVEGRRLCPDPVALDREQRQAESLQASRRRQ